MFLRPSRRFSLLLPQFQQSRSAVVVSREHTPPRLPPNATQEQIDKSVITNDYKYFRYNVVKETDLEPANVKVILLRPSEEFGRKGQILTLNGKIARQELLLPGFAVYASAENLQKYQNIVIPEDSVQYSSPTAASAVAELSKIPFHIVMHAENAWELQPRHIKYALLNQGVHVEESCIEMPQVRISGPDPNVVEKEFLVGLVLNNFEKVSIRCIIFQASLTTLEEIPHQAGIKGFMQH